MAMAKKSCFWPVQSLNYAVYEEMESVTRCLHWEDFMESFEKKMLVPQQVRDSKVFQSDNVLWFAPTAPMEDHNMFGNVSFVIDWEHLLNKMGPHIYEIDQALFNDHSYTRLLLTKEEYTGVNPKLHKVNLDSPNSVLKNENRIYSHIVIAQCKTGRTGPHQLQIAVEADKSDARWLFENCSIFANDHKQANYCASEYYGHDIIKSTGERRVYAPYRCYKYNTGTDVMCPNGWSKKETEQWLTDKNVI